MCDHAWEMEINYYTVRRSGWRSGIRMPTSVWGYRTSAAAKKRRELCARFQRWKRL